MSKRKRQGSVEPDWVELPVRQKPAHCALCQRDVPLTFHHLMPRKMHRRTYFRKHFSKDELNQGVYLCRPCHTGLHRLFDEMTLAKQFNTLDKLKADSKIQKHAEWVAKQKRRY